MNPEKQPHSVNATVLVLGLSAYAVSTLVSMAVMSVGTGVAVISILAGMGWNGFWSGLRDEFRLSEVRIYFWVSVALALSCVMSLVAARIAPVSYLGKHAEILFSKDVAKLWYLFWPLILLVPLRSLCAKAHRKILFAWLVAFGILSVIGIAQHWTGWPRPQRIPGNDSYFHTTLFQGHHLSVASIFTFPFFAALDFCKRESGKRRWLWALIAFAGAGALFGTYSRTMWAALPAGVMLWGFFQLPRRWSVALVALTVLLGVGALQKPAIRDRLFASIGTSERKELWEANWEFFKQRPWIGVGWKHNIELSGLYLLERHPERKSVFSGHAHNNLLDMMSGTGVPGALSWLFWCGFAIWIAWRARWNAEALFATGVLVAWVVFQANGLTQLNFWEGKVSHQLMWAFAWTLLWATSRKEVA